MPLLAAAWLMRRPVRPGRRTAVVVVVHVVKFRHRGVTGLEHFDVQLTGDDAELFRADFSDEAIHQVAPGPETVVGIASHFRQSRHGALEGVGVQVGHARQQRTAQPFGAICVESAWIGSARHRR
jgi:hypothetical protein